MSEEQIRYRISWDMPNVFNPEWHTVTSETDDPWDQYNQLKEWERTGEEPIRNVKLEKSTVVWKPLDEEAARKEERNGASNDG